MNLLRITLAPVLCLAVNAGGQVVLNEIMADNRGAVGNGGEFPDYIELHNPSAQAVALAGFSLTDDPSVPRKYVFPSGLSIPAGGHLVVWCDTSTGAPGQHTGFGLGAKGDRVQLLGANGALLDDVSFGLQLPNLSIGRVPGGSGAWTLTAPTPRQANTASALGTSAQLRINEWMARPLSGEDWVELYNGEGLPVAIGGMTLTDNPTTLLSNRPIPPLSFIGQRGHVQFFASDLARADADHLDFKLGAGGEVLTLYAPDRLTQLDRVTFGSQTDDLSQGRAPDGSDNLVFFPAGRATPGEPNFVNLVTVVISEVLAHTDPPLEDAIELHNPTGAAVDISHWWLSDTSTQPKKYRIPSGTVLPSGGFKVFYQAQFGAGAAGFSLNSSQGDEVYLSAGDAAGNLTGAQTYVEFGATRNGVSVGRHLTSTGVDLVPMSVRTFGVDNPSTLTQFRQGTGRTNAAPRVGPVVISEILFQPDALGDEFIELHNPGASPVPLYHPAFPTNTWRLRGGVTYDFPLNRSLPPGGYLLVVSFDPAQDPAAAAEFRSRLFVPQNVPIVGPYSGALSDAGETIELLWPDETQGPDKPDAGFTPYELVERILYSSAAPWPSGTVGTGHSLQRQSSFTYGNDPRHWVAAAPTAGRPVTEPGQDSDEDGLPDSWELAYRFNPYSPGDASTDGDDDGAANLAEYRSGTDPRDPESVLAIRRIVTGASGLTLVFRAVEGKTYRVQFRTGLEQGGWETLTQVFEASTTGDFEAMIPPPAGPSGILRLVLGGD